VEVASTADRTRSRERAAVDRTGRDGGLSARAAGLVQLQRGAGNRAVAAMLARMGESGALLQREYKPTNNQQKDLNRWVSFRWEQHEDDVADITALIAKWCSSHAQAVQLSELTYDDFQRLRSQFDSADAAIAKHGNLKAAADARPAAMPQARPKADAGKKIDPHLEAKRQIKKAGFKLADFDESDLVLIETSKSEPGVGWATAIAQVRTTKIEKENTARLASERAIKYANAKAIGDTLFSDALAKRIWATAHALAISGSSTSGNPNITLGGDAVTRDEALAAIDDWRAHGTIQAGLVDQLHVPGGTRPIQDKAHRETNPDPDRRFQADFCSYWSNTKINVHVDVLTRTMT
jgi:hypothetical protein